MQRSADPSIRSKDMRFHLSRQLLSLGFQLWRPVEDQRRDRRNRRVEIGFIVLEMGFIVWFWYGDKGQ